MGGTSEAAQRILDLIADRQKSIEEGSGPKKPPLVIYPEGASVTNNTHICPFKRGAFATLGSVRPIVLTYSCKTVDVTSSCLTDEWSIILMSCELRPSYVEVAVLPIFTPNEHLYNRHPNKDKWEAYA